MKFNRNLATSNCLAICAIILIVLHSLDAKPSIKVKTTNIKQPHNVSTTATTQTSPKPTTTTTSKALVRKTRISQPLLEPNSTITNLSESNSTLDQIKSNGTRLVKVDSKPGRMLARMQGKRQADGSGYSRRNEDPWFIDSPPYPLQPYRLAYNVKGKNGQTEQYRQEVGDGKFLTGSYGYVLPDGIYRHVDYVADDRGFRAYIRTSEPGTANQNPADVVINSNPVPVIPGVTYATSGQLKSVTNQVSDFPPTNPYDYSTLRHWGPEPLVRRPPGSIINTPLRNFTSYSFTTQPTLSTLNFDPVLPVLRESNLHSPNLTAPNWNQEPSKTTSHKIGDSLLYQRPLLQPVTKSTDSGLTEPQLIGHSLEPYSHPLTPTYRVLEPLSHSSFKSNNHTVDSDSVLNNFRYVEPYNRTGSSRLSYDQPLGLQQLSPLPKLIYDQNLVHHTNWHPLTVQGQDHHSSNLNLGYPETSFNLHGNSWLPYIRPSNGGYGELGRLNIGPVLSQYSGSQHSKGSSSSESSHDSYHRSEHETGGPDFSRVTVTKEHRSGSRNGTGREYEYRKDEPVDSADLLPPPPPRFTPSPQTGTAHVTRVSNHIHPPLESAVKGGDNLIDFKHTTTNHDRPVEDYSTKSVELQNQFTQRPTTIGTTATTFATKAPSGKDEPFARGPIQSPAQIIRMPEDYRSTMMMADVKSMQNALGLPQPPRLNRSPRIDLNEDSLNAGLKIADQIVSARLAHVETLLTREAPVGGPPTAPPIISPPPLIQPAHPELQNPANIGGQAASSIQHQTVALRSIGQEPVKVKSSSKVKNSTFAPPSSNLTSNRRRMNTGPLSKLVNFSQPNARLIGVPIDLSIIDGKLADRGANDTAAFEAQRLVKAAAKLQAEKVSELEKFQQRLRTQQLLLEHVKNQPNNRSASTSGANNRTSISNKINNRPLGESNSHVKFDEDTEPSARNSIETEQQNRKSELRLRRQEETTNDTSTATTPTKLPHISTTITTTTTATTRKPPSIQVNATRFLPLSDLAKHIQSWPSIISINSINKTVNNTISNESSKQLKNGKQLSSSDSMEKPQQLSTTTAKPPETSTDAGRIPTPSQRVNNSINLDFINSVTALSMDNLNPFSLSSVNPAIKRTNNEARLSPYKLGESIGGGSGHIVGVATSNARYYNSPELLAAMARYDTGIHARSLTPEINDIGSWASNHRFTNAGGGSKPYGRLMDSVQPNSMGQTSHSTSATNSPPMITPISTMSLHNHQMQSSTPAAVSSLHDYGQSRNSVRDGFEIQGGAIELGSHKFFEVVSSNRPISEASQAFQAFRGMY